MSRVLIINRQRLGDIVGCFPAARLLAQAGHQVDFYCFPQYHSMFRAVSYCRPVGPEALARRAGYERVYDLEIPRRAYDAYRASRIKWRDYVYAKYDDLAGARDLPPHFDVLADVSQYRLPGSYGLAAPTGISQVPSVHGDWFRRQCLALSPGPWYVLVLKPDARTTWGIPLCARALDHLPSLIAGAAQFVTINSAPNVIAAGGAHLVASGLRSGLRGPEQLRRPGPDRPAPTAGTRAL